MLPDRFLLARRVGSQIPQRSIQLRNGPAARECSEPTASIGGGESWRMVMIFDIESHSVVGGIGRPHRKVVHEPSGGIVGQQGGDRSRQGAGVAAEVKPIGGQVGSHHARPFQIDHAVMTRRRGQVGADLQRNPDERGLLIRMLMRIADAPTDEEAGCWADVVASGLLRLFGHVSPETLG